MNTNPFVTMKLQRLTLTAVVILTLYCVMPCFAQYEDFYKADSNVYITTKTNVQLYEFPASAYGRHFTILRRGSINERNLIDITHNPQKKLKKPQQLRVLGYTNISKQQGFDAYIVDYKYSNWVLCSSDVQDNTAIEERNIKILSLLQELETKQQKYTQQLDSLVAIYYKESSDSLNYYRNLKTKLPAIRDSLAKKAFNEWLEKQTASVRNAASIIQIDESRLCSPNSVGGCDYHLYYTNISSKTIKYLHWTGKIYNRVNDPAYCEVRRSSLYSGVETGPISPGDLGGGVWECIVYNHAADTVKLNNIIIDYTDGSHFSLSASDIAALVKAPRIGYKRYIDSEDNNERNAACNSVISDRMCDKKMALWATRANNMKFIWSNREYRGDWQYDKIYRHLDSIKSEIRNTQAEAGRLEQFINFEIY